MNNMTASLDLFNPDRIPIALMAFVLCAVIGMITGPMHGNANPFIWGSLDALLGRIGVRLDRAKRKSTDLFIRGFGLTMLAILLGFIFAVFMQNLANNVPLWGMTTVIAVSLSMTAGTIWYSLLRVYTAVDQGTKVSPGAYRNIVKTTRTDLSRMDDFGITRVTMAMVARSFDKGLVAPVFWYLCLGLTGAYIYAVVAALAWRFNQDGNATAFAKFPAMLEKIMGYIPMTLAGNFMAVAGLFTPTGGMTRAFFGIMKKEVAAPYEQGGLALTAMAYSLNVSLNGPVNDLEGHVIKRRWVGPEGATAKLEIGQLRRALYISFMAHLLFIVTLLGILMWVTRLGI
jgi:adenosylcobinamide-phosphate synthase